MVVGYGMFCALGAHGSWVKKVCVVRLHGQWCEAIFGDVSVALHGAPQHDPCSCAQHVDISRAQASISDCSRENKATNEAVQ